MQKNKKKCKKSKKSPESTNCWLIKFAPFRTSWSEIVARGTFTMRGVRNPQARNNLAAMHVGDPVFFYHSQQERAIVGMMHVSRAAYPDPTSADSKWLTCDFVPAFTLQRHVTPAALRLDPRLADLPLLKQPRLAVMPLQAQEFEIILDFAHAEGTSWKDACATIT